MLRVLSLVYHAGHGRRNDLAARRFASLVTATGNIISTFVEPGGPLSSVEYSPNGRRLAGIGTDGSVTFWPLR